MKLKKGDFINTIMFSLPLIGSSLKPSITVRLNREVIKAGDKTFTVVGNLFGNRRYPQESLNCIVDARFKNSYALLLPADADMKKEIEKIEIKVLNHYKKLSSSALELSKLYSDFSDSKVDISEDKL